MLGQFPGTAAGFCKLVSGGARTKRINLTLGQLALLGQLSNPTCTLCGIMPVVIPQRHEVLVVVMSRVGHIQSGMDKHRNMQEGTMSTSSKTELGTKSMPGAMVRVEAIVTVPIVQVVKVIDPEMAVMAMVITQDWITPKQSRVKVQVAVNMAVQVRGIIEITEVVMAIARSNEHVEPDRIQVNHTVRAVDE
jgi:hypothetical protein